MGIKNIRELFEEADKNNKKTLRESWNEMTTVNEEKPLRESWEEMTSVGRSLKEVWNEMTGEKNK